MMCRGRRRVASSPSSRWMDGEAAEAARLRGLTGLTLAQTLHRQAENGNFTKNGRGRGLKNSLASTNEQANLSQVN